MITKYQPDIVFKERKQYFLKKQYIYIYIYNLNGFLSQISRNNSPGNTQHCFFAFMNENFISTPGPVSGSNLFFNLTQASKRLHTLHEGGNILL